MKLFNFLILLIIFVIMFFWFLFINIIGFVWTVIFSFFRIFIDAFLNTTLFSLNVKLELEKEKQKEKEEEIK